MLQGARVGRTQRRAVAAPRRRGASAEGEDATQPLTAAQHASTHCLVLLLPDRL